MTYVDYLHPMNSSFEIIQLAVYTDSYANHLKSHLFATARAFIEQLAVSCFQLTSTSLFILIYIYFH